jgi:hypothetical protein
MRRSTVRRPTPTEKSGPGRVPVLWVPRGKLFVIAASLELGVLSGFVVESARILLQGAPWIYQQQDRPSPA